MFFCGHHNSSWHGTTVQVLQPLPSLSLPEYCAESHHEHSLDECRLTMLGTQTTAPSDVADAVSLSQTTAPSDVTDAVSLSQTTAPSDVTDAVSLSQTTAPSDVTDAVSLSQTTAPSDATDAMFHSQTTAPSDVNDSNVDMSRSHGGISQKRLERSSPFPSPTKLTRSPLTKVPRRPRTGTESKKAADTPQNKPIFHLPGPVFPHNSHKKRSNTIRFRFEYKRNRDPT